MSKPLNILLVVFMTSLLGLGCSEKDNAFRNQFRWLSGKWEGSNEGTELIEQWIWNKTRFEGQAFEIKGGDTLLVEDLFLDEYNGIPGYAAIVNGDGPFMFAFKGEKDGVYEFQNEEHDFPSIIRYRYDSDSSITISLMSKESPNEANLSYQLKRIQR